MATDARMSTALPHHPKTVKLYRRLGAEGCWHLVCLFLWVAASRPTGNLVGMTDEDIEIAAGWNGKAGHFAATLAEVRFLDGDVGSRFVHDWAEHNPWAVSRDKRVAAARAAAAARWQNDPNAARMRGACDSQESAMPTTKPNPTQPIPNPTTTTTSSQSQSSIGDKKKKRRTRSEVISTYSEKTRDTVNALLKFWPSQQPKDGSEIQVDVPLLAVRIDELLLRSDLSPELLVRGA